VVSDVRAFFALVAMIKKIAPDVIHTHTAKAGVLGRLAAILAGRSAKRVHTFHGHLLHGYFSGWKVKLVIAIEKFLAKHTDVLVAVGNDQYRVFYPGLVEPAKISKEKARQQFDMALGDIYVAYVGRMTAIKRPDRLLNTAAEIKARNLPVKFIVAGEGDLFEATERDSERRDLPVRFLGWRKDIGALFAASDIAILTSDNEGIPLTLIQAAQASLPIVATGVGSVSDIVVHEVNGYLVDSEPAALADALQKLAIDPVLREIMGKAGRERATRYFSLEKMCADHTDLYQLLHR
jgi:glycosyltransferase involved in cell wall biosynthesis